jgi:hypothetical protein
MAMEYFDIPPGMKVYTLDICEALNGDHDLCPGFTTLKAGEHEFGPVDCICPCHKKVDGKPS